MSDKFQFLSDTFKPSKSVGHPQTQGFLTNIQPYVTDKVRFPKKSVESCIC